jgi:hypothetical protein
LPTPRKHKQRRHTIVHTRIENQSVRLSRGRSVAGRCRRRGRARGAGRRLPTSYHSTLCTRVTLNNRAGPHRDRRRRAGARGQSLVGARRPPTTVRCVQARHSLRRSVTLARVNLPASNASDAANLTFHTGRPQNTRVDQKMSSTETNPCLYPRSECQSPPSFGSTDVAGTSFGGLLSVTSSKM